MKLHLGVTDIPYAGKGATTTGEVAEYLEKDFHVMQVFFDRNSGFIAESLENGLAGSLEILMMGQTPKDPFAGAMSKVENRFREYIAQEEHGIMTKQKMQGTGMTGARFKRQYRKAPQKKTVFVETGLYRRNFKSWISE